MSKRGFVGRSGTDRKGSRPPVIAGSPMFWLMVSLSPVWAIPWHRTQARIRLIPAPWQRVLLLC